MMQKIIIQPCSSKTARDNFGKTIANFVDLDRIKHFLSSEQQKILDRIYPTKKVNVWGVVDGKKACLYKQWEQISDGDVVLFCWNKAFHRVGSVACTFVNEELSKNLWGDASFKNIYFLSNMKDIDISQEKMNSLIGYDENNIFRGFRVLSVEKSFAAISELENHFDNIKLVVSEDDFLEAIDKLCSKESFDREVPHKQRIEQSFLRKSLFGNAKECKCELCGEEFPIEFLVAAHIKRRAECSQEERKDFKNIVMPLCSFGCDSLFEKGYIIVEDKKFVVNPSKNVHKGVQKRLDALNGRVCLKWNENTKKYFDAHKSRFEQ